MKKIFLVLAASLSMVACKLDDNIDPNLPREVDLSPKEMLGAAQTMNYDAQVGGMYQLSNIWMNAWAGNEYYFAAPMTREYQMDITSNFYQGIWTANYLGMANYAGIINNNKASQYPYHVAIAKVLLANSMQYIVDFYGDAPYSEAFKQQQNLSPKYDKGEDIYKDLVLKINEAVALIDAAPTANPVGSEDVIFHGDMQKWKAYANTVKLRLLLRQSKVTDPAIVTFRNAQLASLANASFINASTGDVTINPGYGNTAEEKQNPLIRNYGWLNFSDTAYNTYGYRYYGMASDHFGKMLNGDASKPTAGVVDGRRSILFRPVGGIIKGIVQGGGKVPGGSEAAFSRFRWTFYNYSSATSGMNGYLMTVAESELLQAEAATLYPSIFSNGQGHFEEAVRQSFAFYYTTYYNDPSYASAGTSAANSYLTALNNSATFQYKWSSNPIAAIQWQRMVALTYTRPMETYINYLKTGYPDTPLALTAIKGNKPYRIMYPSSEYTANSTNVPNVTADQCFVKNQYTPFWNRN